jgi:hypothetical protein
MKKVNKEHTQHGNSSSKKELLTGIKYFIFIAIFAYVHIFDLNKYCKNITSPPHVRPFSAASFALTIGALCVCFYLRFSYLVALLLERHWKYNKEC